jgi:adenylate cyclase
MNYQINILVISSRSFVKDALIQHINTEELGDIELLQAPTMEEAENTLFEQTVSCIMMEWELEGASEFIFNLKNDEMFRLLPILVLTPDDSTETISQVYQSGADTFAPMNAPDQVLALYLKPLVTNNALKEELVKKVSDLQERSIRDFILLDLIKKFIPKTIWDIAQKFAEEQKIRIPEKEMELTICFADLKGFTKMSEHLKPREVIENLNSVFDIVTTIVYQNGGDVDKFIGDAFFGIFEEAHAAVKSMIQIQKELEVLNHKRVENELPMMQFRIGVHTGPVIRGNVGGHMRYDNTLIGDTVNTASRLEQMSKAGDILITETTRAKAGIEIPMEYQFQVSLRGRDARENVYQIYEFLKESF